MIIEFLKCWTICPHSLSQSGELLLVFTLEWLSLFGLFLQHEHFDRSPVKFNIDGWPTAKNPSSLKWETNST